MAAVVQIETCTPDKSYTQKEVQDLMLELYSDRKARQYIKGIYPDSGITKRHSVIEEFSTDSEHSFFKEIAAGEFQEPCTEVRNNIFKEEARKIIKKLARQAFSNNSSIKASEITHLITVSCTGFYNPGPDLDLIKELQLAEDTERYHIGFMGCYAAFPALRMAKQFCDAREDAKVMIVCLELCTLHFQLNNDLDSIIANSVFSDGAAMAIVSNQTNAPALKLNSFSSAYLPEGETDMAWDIGNNGFNIRLSKYVPQIINSSIEEILQKALSKQQRQLEDTDIWAVHPGGKSIIDKVQQSLKLEDQQLQASRNVLSEFGNMSSSTILFVLKELLSSSPKSRQEITALAFGPGLVVESGFLTLE